MNKSTLLKLHRQLKPRMAAQIAGFRTIGRTVNDDQLFPELAFCLFTPQSRALSCWAAVEELCERGMLMGAKQPAIAAVIAGKGVRFKNNKARYLIEARRFCTPGTASLRRLLAAFPTPVAAREWLVTNVKGMGLKEASHFLRNTGYGEDLAILDRHILKNLVKLGVIKEIPASLTPRVYLSIEVRMRSFSKKTGIPMAHLDLLLWYHETGSIFK